MVAGIDNKQISGLQHHPKSPPPTAGFSRMLLAWQVTAWATQVGIHNQQVCIEIPHDEGRLGWWDAVKDGKYLVNCSFVRLRACGGNANIQNV